MNKKCFLRLYVKWADLGFVNRIDNVQQSCNEVQRRSGVRGRKLFDHCSTGVKVKHLNAAYARQNCRRPRSVAPTFGQ